MFKIINLFILFFIFTSFQGCKETLVATDSASGADQSTQSSCVINGVTVQNNKSRVFYDNQTASSACVGQSRKCVDGVLSGSDSYKYSYCVVSRPIPGGGSGTLNSACSWNGSPVPSGSSVLAYQAAKAPAGQTCSSISQSRVCVNGKLSHVYGSNDIGYDYATCVDNDPCDFNSVSIPHNQSVTAYKTSTVSMSTSCDRFSETRKCINGVLSGSFTASSCSQAAPSCSITLTSFANQTAVTSVVRESTMAIRWNTENADAVDSFQCSHSDVTATSDIPSAIYTVPYGIVSPVRVPNKVGTFTCSIKAKSSTYESTCNMSITILPKYDLVVDTRTMLKLLYNVDAYLDPSSDFAISTDSTSAYQQLCTQYGVRVGRDLPLRVKANECRTQLPSTGTRSYQQPLNSGQAHQDCLDSYSNEGDRQAYCYRSATEYIIEQTFTTQRRAAGVWSSVIPLNAANRTSLSPAGTGSTGCLGGYLKTVTCGE